MREPSSGRVDDLLMLKYKYQRGILHFARGIFGELTLEAIAQAAPMAEVKAALAQTARANNASAS